MKEKSMRMFPYGGYDPFSTPTAKGYANSQQVPDRPPYAPATPSTMPQQQYSQGFNHQPYMPYMIPMMPPGMPHPMMPGMPFNQKQGQGNQMGMYQNNQGSGLNFGKMMGGANQVMGLAQQMGNILSFFK